MENGVVANIIDKFSEGVFAVDPLERVHIDEKLRKYIEEHDPRFDKFYQGASHREIAEVEQTSAESKRKIVEAYAMALSYAEGPQFTRRLMTKLVNRGSRSRTDVVNVVCEEEKMTYRPETQRRSSSFYAACLGLNLF
ncbi:hypothetical protein KY335_05640 [Candidatus Woesearchaeota archaeon]|nr:hypothetical protein [Candidatus Woesearchaeota archaeon]MBW3014689.1 hypothetical protein [Candidatus Woesearchaeota archaeon]